MLATKQLSVALRHFRLRNAIIGPKTLGPLRLKWLSGKDARGPEVPLGLVHGHPDDPDTHTWDSVVDTTPDCGGKRLPHFVYRQAPPGRTYMDYKITYIISALLWYWFTYHMYYHYHTLIGHEYMPYLEEFTDEELGILPDDAPDPEYWGNHYEPYGTYR
uniref:NADH dehydrogenase [ubiquinone] 1 beta subcomplex subunit 2, mitochondrial n=1 Tax=Syphacia muris TaxID=451379 RepID=A0A0N5ANY2_9BILA